MVGANQAIQPDVLVKMRIKNVQKASTFLRAPTKYVEGENELNKGCACFQYAEETGPYQPFTLQELQDQQAFLAELNKGGSSPPNDTTEAPKGALTCSFNSVSAVPTSFKETTGDVKPNQLLYTLRQVICTNSCGQPAGLPNGVSAAIGSKTVGDCEVTIPIAGGIEAVSPNPF
ncbi:MAG: hypothetical protein Q9220_004535 [cf. Caloplaca sp. 1 TL-2023]